MPKGSAKRKRTRAVLSGPLPLDATPERLAKGDDHEFVNPAEIDSSEQPIGHVRRFRMSHLDRLYRHDNPKRFRFTDRQYMAGEWYRNQHQRCHFALSVVASYGERTSAGEPSYGLPRSEAQLRARRLFMEARAKIGVTNRGALDRFVIHDDVGMRYRNGNERTSVLDQVSAALDELGDWLKLPWGKKGA